MKNILAITAVSAAMTLSAVAMAAKPKPPQPPQNTNTPQVFIYAKPGAKTPVKKVSPAVGLVPIFQKGDWMKVGDPRNGAVGWINRDQFQQAQQAFFQPELQSVYIYSNSTKNGKPQVNIVVYKNGKQVTGKEAEKLYKQFQKEQRQQDKAMRHEMRSMNREFNQPPFNQPMPPAAGWEAPGWMPEPVVIFQNGPAPQPPAPPKDRS